tara:strand:+ start:131 stop:442 length:312 start_codon:yes stop_codon:yes gene_type:complete
VFQRVNSALLAYLELIKNLGEGRRFYADFRNHVKARHIQSRDFAMARNVEADSLLQQIEEYKKSVQHHQQYAPPPSQQGYPHQQQPHYPPQQQYPPPQQVYFS